MMERDDERPSCATRPRSPSGGMRAGTRPRCSGTPAAWRRWRSVMSSAAGARWARCRVASRNGWCSRRCCAARPRCCCSTSRTTTWTCRASAGSNSSSPPPGRRCCWSATTGSCSRTAAERIITVEDGNVWVHGGGFASYAQARRDRIERLDELRRRWDEEHEKIKQLVRMYRQKASYNDAMASRLSGGRDPAAAFRGSGAAGTGAAGAERPDAAARRPDRQTGGDLREPGADRADARPFDLEVWYGERMAVLGSNGSGKSSFLRLLAGADVPHRGWPGSGRGWCPGCSRRLTPGPIWPTAGRKRF